MSVRGLSFVLTGTMSRVRSEIVDAIRQAGGRYADKNVSSANYVVVGKRIGLNKLDAAVRQGVPFITENELWRLIRGERDRPRTITRDQVVQFTNDQMFNESSLYRAESVAASNEAARQVGVRPAMRTEPETPGPEGFSISDFFQE